MEGIQEEIGQDGSSEMSSQEKKSAFQNKDNSEMNRGTRPDSNVSYLWTILVLK